MLVPIYELHFGFPESNQLVNLLEKTSNVLEETSNLLESNRSGVLHGSMLRTVWVLLTPTEQAHAIG